MRRVLLVLFLAIAPFLVSGAFLEINFGEAVQPEPEPPADSSELQWFFDGAEYNLGLNIESADLGKEYLIDFGIGDAFVFDGSFPSTAFLVHAFASTDQTFVVSGLSGDGDCDFFLLGNVFGQSSFDRIVLREQSFPVSIVRDESVHLSVDADSYGSCRLRFESGDGAKALNFSVNFKFVPSAYEILEPYLLSCADAPNDKCFRVGGQEYNYSELVERGGCPPEVFLGGTEIVGGPPKACDEAEKEKLREDVLGKEKLIASLEEKQVPEVVALIEGFQVSFGKMAQDINALFVQKEEGSDSLNLGLVLAFFVLVIGIAFAKFRRPRHLGFQGLGVSAGGGLLSKGKGFLSGVKESVSGRRTEADEALEGFASFHYEEPKPLEEVVPEKGDLREAAKEKVLVEMKEGFSEELLDKTGVRETIDFLAEEEANAVALADDEKAEVLFEAGLREERKLVKK